MLHTYPTSLSLTLDFQFFCSPIHIFSFIFIFNSRQQDEVLAISERVVIRADDLLNWCDDTINWSYGLRATTLLHPTIKNELNENCDNHSDGAHSKNESDLGDDSITTSTNIRSLKNSKLDFTDVEKEKGTHNIQWNTHICMIWQFFSKTKHFRMDFDFSSKQIYLLIFSFLHFTPALIQV